MNIFGLFFWALHFLWAAKKTKYLYKYLIASSRDNQQPETLFNGLFHPFVFPNQAFVVRLPFLFFEWKKNPTVTTATTTRKKWQQNASELKSFEFHLICIETFCSLPPKPAASIFWHWTQSEKKRCYQPWVIGIEVWVFVLLGGGKWFLIQFVIHEAAAAA